MFKIEIILSLACMLHVCLKESLFEINQPWTDMKPPHGCAVLIPKYMTMTYKCQITTTNNSGVNSSDLIGFLLINSYMNLLKLMYTISNEIMNLIHEMN